MFLKNLNNKFISCFVIFFIAKQSFSQIYTDAIKTSVSLSNNGLGNYISVGYARLQNKNLYDLEINIQTEKINFSGIQTNYKRIISLENDENLKLFFYGNLTYHHSSYLSNNSIRYERYKENKSSNYQYQKFRVIESYIGFGLMLQHNDISNSIVSVGMGGFETIDKNYNYKMYRQKQGPSIQFQYSCYFNLIK